MSLSYFGAVNVTLSPQLEKFVADQVASGRFSSATEMVTLALEALGKNPLNTSPIFPPGSLTDTFTADANAAEEKESTRELA
jgi:hypothetical protein